MGNLKWRIEIGITKHVVSFFATFLLLVLSCKSQSTFSERYAYGYSTVFTMVMNTDYGYLAIGEGRDTVGEYLAPMLAVAFDDNGNWISTKKYGSTNLEFVYDTQSDSNVRLNDSTFVILTKYFHESSDTNFIAAMWLNEYGDSLQTKRYTSPYYIEGVLNTDYNSPASLAISEDGEYLYYAAQIFHSTSQNNFMIKKLTAQGDEVWTYLNPLNNGYYCNSIVFYNEQVWFIRTSLSDNSIFGLNSVTGLVETSQVLFPTSLNYITPNDILVESGNFVLATSQSDSSGDFIPIVYSCSFDGEEIFQTSPTDAAFGFVQTNDHLVKSTDGGYVSCSVKYEEQTNPADPNDPSSNNTSEKIWLWKVNSEGEFEWQRFYEYLSFDSGYFYLNNTALDMKATPDGGFIMAGEATAGCLEWPCLAGDPFTQQGWLLKVDGCGCLVPGCDESCIVDVAEQEDGSSSDTNRQYMKVGPNPASDVLHIYLSSLSSNPSSGCYIQLHDLQGNVIRSLHLKQDDTTYIIDTASLPNGEYILSLMSAEKEYENMLLQSKKIVVAH